MRGRYSGEPVDLNFGPSGSLGSEQPKPRKPDPLEDFLRLAAGIAPLAGAGIGAGVGAAVGGVPGAGVGMGIGGAAGSAAGMGLGYAADKRAEPSVMAEEARLARERERAARAQAALSLV